MSDDSELSRLFREARREDEAGAPVFAELRQRVPRRTQEAETPALSRRLVMGLAAVILVLLAVTIARSRSPQDPSPPPGAVEAFLSRPSWSAPTDFLLETPARELLHSTPSIDMPIGLVDPGSLEPKKGTRT